MNIIISLILVTNANQIISEYNDINSWERSIEDFMLIGINEGISYYLCNIIENYVYYSNKSVCEKCLDDFYCFQNAIW